MFRSEPYGSRMTDKPLSLASRQEVSEALGYALRFGRSGKPHRHASDYMARIAADVLAEHLELAGFVVMKKPPAPLHSGTLQPNAYPTKD